MAPFSAWDRFCGAIDQSISEDCDMANLPALTTMLVSLLAACPSLCKEQEAGVTIAGVGALLAGRYDNSAQVAQGAPLAENRTPQHVTITVEPTQRPDWSLWRVHMDVDRAVAQAAGSDTSLDAVWAMRISREAKDKTLRLIPHALSPSVNPETLNAAAFDPAQWLSLEACMLGGDFGTSRVVAAATADEMCVAETMGLGGKRAFLPSRIEREGAWLHVQLIYFGQPWRVDARRLAP
jgi:hypothetical protein